MLVMSCQVNGKSSTGGYGNLGEGEGREFVG